MCNKHNNDNYFKYFIYNESTCFNVISHVIYLRHNVGKRYFSVLSRDLLVPGFE